MAKTVLIVEDNELNMKLFRDLLEAHGYQTSGTSNGFEKSRAGSRTIRNYARFRWSRSPPSP
jgi:CheY-like chemotaxis protein